MSITTCASSELRQARSQCTLLLCAALVWLICGQFHPAVHAQAPQSADKAMAEALFDRGLSLMREGKYAEACTQLEHSQEIERGIGTLLYLGECYEKLGKTASAWATFREAASFARAENQLDRARTGTTRASLLQPLLSRITVHVPAEHQVQGLTVTRNGQVVPVGAYGVALPVDPGTQQISASAPGRHAWSLDVALPPNGANVAVDVPLLEIDEAAAAQLAAPPVVTPPAAAEEGEIAQPAKAPKAALSSVKHASWQRPVGLVVGAVGLAALGVGAFFGVQADSANKDLERACPQEVCASSNRHLQKRADDRALVSTISVVSGAALLGVGTVLFLTAPTRESAVSVSARAGSDGAMLQLRGAL